MPTVVVVDTGPLIAAFDANDPDYAACTRLLLDSRYSFVIPQTVVVEVSYLMARKFGPGSEVAFLRTLPGLVVTSAVATDWSRIADLVEKYKDFPLGLVDASVVAIAERMGTEYIGTLDYRHFRAVRPRHVESFTLLP